MTLTRDFMQTVKARAQRGTVFREAFLTESVECLLAGDMDVGKAVLRSCIGSTKAYTSRCGPFGKGPQGNGRV